MPGPPEDRAKHQIRFRLADAMNNKSKFEIAPRAWLFARTVTTEGTWDASFSYRPTAPSVANDYYYLRIVQIDGEAAWTSPVWIGK